MLAIIRIIHQPLDANQKPVTLVALIEKTMTASALMQRKSPIQSSSTTNLIAEHSKEANGEAQAANMMVVHSGSAFRSQMIQ